MKIPVFAYQWRKITVEFPETNVGSTVADVGLVLWDCSLGLLRPVGSTNAFHQTVNKGRRMGRFCIISCF